MKPVNYNKSHRSEDGFVLITAMVVMIAVSLLGIAALNTTTFETMIAGNEKFAQEQFFLADSGVNLFMVNGTEPAILQAQGTGFVCQDDLTGTSSVGHYSPGNIPGNNVWIFFAERTLSIPPVDEFRICAVRGNGQTIASLTVGINFGLPPGGLPGSGGLEY